jgi:hypothetical protein
MIVDKSTTPGPQPPLPRGLARNAHRALFKLALELRQSVIDPALTLQNQQRTRHLLCRVLLRTRKPPQVARELEKIARRTGHHVPPIWPLEFTRRTLGRSPHIFRSMKASNCSNRISAHRSRIIHLRELTLAPPIPQSQGTHSITNGRIRLKIRRL